MSNLPSWLRSEYDFRGTLARGSRGKRVKLAQEWLNLDGGIQIVSDGIFGPATQAAVKLFQKKHGLPESGKVVRATFDALTAPLGRVLEPILADGRSFHDLVVAYAEQHEREHPREVGGQNRGPWVRLYMKGHEGPEFPWCAGFVSFVTGQAASTFDARLEIPYTVSCDVIAVEGKHRNRFVPERQIQLVKAELGGGSIFLNRRTSTDWVHTGIVVRFGDNMIETIEGNTNDDGSREGFEVVRRFRGYKKKDFVRLD